MSRYLSDDCSCDDEVVEERCGCGSRDTCASAGAEVFCSPCWHDYQQEKRARQAVRDVAEQARLAAAERDADWKALAGL
jgi:hypothetical protein